MSHTSVSKRGFKARVIGLVTSLAMAMSLSVAIAPAAHAADSVGVDVNPTALEFGAVDFSRRNYWPWIAGQPYFTTTGLTDGSPIVGANGVNYYFKSRWTGLDVPPTGCLTELSIKVSGAPRSAGWSNDAFNAAFDSVSGEQAVIKTSGASVPGQVGPAANMTGLVFQYRASANNSFFYSWGGFRYAPATPSGTEFHTFTLPLSTSNITAADLAAGNFYVNTSTVGGLNDLFDELTGVKLSYRVTAEPCVNAAPPRITSVSPSEGVLAGGTPITITGTRFENGSTVKVAGADCTNVVVVSATEITCTTPSGTAGTADVEVRFEGETYVSAINGFWFANPPTNVTVTAADKAMNYGESFPAFTTDNDAAVSGLDCDVYASTDTGFATPLVAADVSQEFSPYVIRCSGANASGYVVDEFIDGELVVTGFPPTDIEVTVDDKEMTVGDDFPTWTTDQDGNITELACNVYLTTDTGFLDALEASELTVEGSPYVIHCTGLEGDPFNITGWNDGQLMVVEEGANNGGSTVCKSVPLKVIFKGDSAKLTKKAKKALRGYAKKVVASGCTTVVLNGFTAKFTGTKQKALRLSLSKKRNNAVQKYLKTQFTALDFTAKFVKKSNGGKNPVVSNSDKNDRWKNRRVEIILRKVIFA